MSGERPGASGERPGSIRGTSRERPGTSGGHPGNVRGASGGIRGPSGSVRGASGNVRGASGERPGASGERPGAAHCYSTPTPLLPPVLKNVRTHERPGTVRGASYFVRGASGEPPGAKNGGKTMRGRPLFKSEASRTRVPEPSRGKSGVPPMVFPPFFAPGRSPDAPRTKYEGPPEASGEPPGSVWGGGAGGGSGTDFGPKHAPETLPQKGRMRNFCSYKSETPLFGIFMAHPARKLPYSQDRFASKMSKNRA